MFVVVLAGGIASGKSTVARELGAKGAQVVDLDALSRDLTCAGSPTVAAIAQAFGADVLDADGALLRGLLAERAFASPERTRELERITHPAIRERLGQWLAAQDEDVLCVVEVPLLDRVEDVAASADEVLCVTCPADVRRERAVRRGMSAQDFNARAARQPTDEYLASHATTLINTEGGREALLSQVDAWWTSHHAG